MKVRITQLDGKLPNIALMKLSAYHKSIGDEVFFSKSPMRDMFEPEFGLVYGSCIFGFSQDNLKAFLREFPNAIVGGTGTTEKHNVEDIIGNFHDLDYSIYPEVDYSIGFLQRGCRLKCKFCVVPEKEGKPRSNQTAHQLWRGDPYPKKLHILDNDFFGNPEWQHRIEEIIEGKFQICLSQGINVRLINDEQAVHLARVNYRDTNFKSKRLYTAWDNLGHERIFFDGIDRLEKAGINPSHIMAYMLIGYDPKETWELIFERFNKMVERKIMPYPMVFNNQRKDLKAFQRWVVTGQYRWIPWSEYPYNPQLRGVKYAGEIDIYGKEGA